MESVKDIGGTKRQKYLRSSLSPQNLGPISIVCYTLGKVLCGVRGHFRQAGREHEI